MELTAAAASLNQVFFETDKAIMGAFHSMAESAGGFLTPFLSALTLTAWKGALLILIALVLIAVPKTRRTGLCALVALAVGVVITNVLLKNVVARPRPYNFDEMIHSWWVYVGSNMETGGSFPSGHMTAACDFCTGIVLARGKKWLPVTILYAVLMGASRVYLMVHFPSDVCFGALVGICAGVAAFFLVKAIYRKWGTTKFLANT